MVEEELRVLYVALTRPKERLFMTASVSAKELEGGVYDLWREDGVYAWKNKYFSQFALREASTYIDLLLTALADKTDSFLMDTVFETAAREEAPEQARETEEKTACEPEAEDMTYAEARALVAERLDYVYPYRRLSEIPSKLAVSALYPTVLDEADTAKALSEDDDLTMAVPNFLLREDGENATAAERGTAMHTFMQFCDFARTLERGVAAEIEYLAEKRFIFESDREKMDMDKLEAFFKSPLAARIMASSDVFREKRFMIKLPARLFTDETGTIPEGEKILVQGVIDCAFFDENGELVLVDYKTDFFAPGTPRRFVEKTLRERHARQLGYYKLACETLFGRLPAHTYIYSFALGGTLEV
jgi:ATP-dependent helicase/nuclease subunit A